MIASWGPKNFIVNPKSIYTFDKITRSSSYTTEDKENGSKKPKLKNKHPNLEEMSFSIALNARCLKYNILKEIDSWASLCGKSYYFIIGNTSYGNHKWELVGSNATEQILNIYGNIISAKIELSFKERPGKMSKSTKAKNTRNTKSKAKSRARAKAKSKQ